MTKKGIIISAAVAVAVIAVAAAGFGYVSSLPKSLELSATEVNIKVGDKGEVLANVLPESARDKSVTFMIADESIATVGDRGYIRTEKEGTTTITVVSNANPQLKATCTVNVLPIATGIEAADVDVMLGETKKVEYKVLPENAADKNVKFKISDTSVVTIADDGTITPVSVGSASVTVKSVDGPEATLVVTVNQEVESVSLNQASVTVAKGSSVELIATTAPEKANIGTKTAWTSFDEGVAIVSETGAVTGMKAGETRITCTTENGKTAECNVSVYVAQKATVNTGTQGVGGNAGAGTAAPAPSGGGSRPIGFENVEPGETVSNPQGAAGFTTPPSGIIPPNVSFG